MLGEPDPIALLENMDERTFQLWNEFWDVEPFGPDVQNRMMARIAANAGMTSGDENELMPRASRG